MSISPLLINHSLCFYPGRIYMLHTVNTLNEAISISESTYYCQFICPAKPDAQIGNKSSFLAAEVFSVFHSIFFPPPCSPWKYSNHVLNSHLQHCN